MLFTRLLYPLYQQRGAPEFDDVAVYYFFSPASFDSTIDSDLPVANQQLGLASGGDKALEFKDFVELDWLSCYLHSAHMFSTIIAPGRFTRSVSWYINVYQGDSPDDRTPAS